MEPMMRLVRWGTGLLLFSAFASLAVWGQELSHARIVRLSFTEGVVTVQRPDVDEWASAPTNTPIQEGFKIATGDSAFAEVEFENASTARIGQLSLLEFTQLALLPSGGKVNRMTLSQGYATFTLVPEADDSYEVTAGTATLTPQGKARFRVDMDEGILQVKVFKGSVEIMSPEGTGTLGKNTVLEIRPGGEEPFQISQGISKDAWDEWVEERESRMELVRHQGAPKLYSNNASDLMWGMMDLMSFGNWMSIPGYGYGWTPNMGMGWSPYTAGRWCWYPSMGYTWISHEPWGWLPYHYGSWIHDASIGWSWIPTGGFGSWSPALVNWYQGPGWVGWSPMSPMLGGSAYNCPRTQGCVAIAPEGALRSGQSVNPGGLRWGHPDTGRPVQTVDVQPERAAMLPGSARGAFGAFPRGSGATNVGRDARDTPTPGSVSRGFGAAGGTVSRPETSGPIVLDPETRQYVNNPIRTIAPNSPPTPGDNPAPSGSTGGFSRGGGAINQGTRAGPQSNYPSPVARGTGGPGAIAPRGDPGRVSSDDRDSVNVSRGAWSGGGDSGRNTSSAGRSSSSTSSRSDSGSRSSAGSSSSGSSGGSRSSGSSSGGSGGGSSSGGHSSGGSSGGGWSGGSSGGGHSSGGGSSGGFGGGGGHSGGSGGGGGGGSHGPSGGGSSRGPR